MQNQGRPASHSGIQKEKGHQRPIGAQRRGLERTKAANMTSKAFELSYPELENSMTETPTTIWYAIS
jgi:hypothetical protein